MKENIVSLSLKEYNELRDFKKEVEENRAKSKYAVISNTFRSGLCNNIEIVKYYAQEEVILDFENKIRELKYKLEMKDVEIENFKKMSYWEILKFKNK